MTQAVGKTFIKAAVDISADNSDWTTVDSHGASIAVSGGTRAVGKQHTFDGDTPIVAGGKRDSIQVEVRFVYTETAAEPFEAGRAIYETAGSPGYVRYSPLGDDTSGGLVFRFTSPLSVMTDFLYPQGSAEGNEVILGSMTFDCPYLTKSDLT